MNGNNISQNEGIFPSEVQKVINAFSEPVFLTDSSGSIIFANDESYNYFNEAEPENNISFLIPEFESRKSEDRFETVVKHYNGKTTDVPVEVKLKKWDNENFLITLRNISDKAELRDKCNAVSNQLKEIQELTHTGIWEWNIAEDKITWSDELYRIYGFDKNNFDGKYETFTSRIHPEDIEYSKSVINKSYETKQPFTYVHRIVLPDGKIRYLKGAGRVETDMSSKVVRMIGTGQDITGQKKLENEILKAKEELENIVSERTKELRESNKLLKQSEAELTDFIENASLAIHWVGPDGKIIWANKKELELLGYTKEEYFGRSIKDFHADQNKINDILKRLSNNETLLNYEAEIICKDGQIKNVLISTNVYLEDGKFKHTRCFTKDITERKRLETTIRESREQYQSIIESAMDSIITTNEALEVIHFNSTAEKMFGVKANEAIGKSLNNFIPLTRQDFNVSINSKENGLPSGKLNELKAAGPGGKELYVEASISPVISGGRKLFTVIIRNITKRKKAEEELIKANEKYINILETISDTFVAVDKDLNITYLNERAMTYFRKMTKEDMIGRHIFDIYTNLKGTYVEDNYRKALKEQKPVFFEMEGTGSGKFFEVNVYPSPDGLTIYVKDISDRKYAQDMLIEQYNFRKAIENSIPAGISTIGLEGEQTYVNPAFCKLLGYEENELIGAIPPFVYWPEDEIENISEAFRRTLASDIPPEGFELVFRKKDGANIDVQVIPTALINNKGEIEGWLASVTDITERKKAQNKLIKEFNLRRAIENSIPEGISTIGLDKRLQYVNPSLCRMLGFNEDELLGKEPPFPYWAEEDFEKIKQIMEISLKGEAPAEGFEVKFKKKNGERIDVQLTPTELLDANGNIEGWLASITDITLKKRAELDIKHSEERFRTIAETANEGIWMVDLNAKTVFANNTMAELLGCPVDELLKLSFTDFIFEEDIPAAWERVEKTLNGLTEEFDFRFRRKDGSELLVLAGTSPVYNSTGKITGALGMFSNITERKRAEKALLESEERFRTLADNISQLAWMTDYEGNLFWYNERWYEYTGTNFEEMKNRGWQKVHDPEYVDRVTEKFDTHIKKGEPWEDVFPLRGKDGKYRWFLSRALPIKDENGNIVRWFGTNTDITDQKKLEDSLLEALESLKNSEEKYKAKSQELETLLDAIPSVVWISHDPESKLMTGNKASYDFLGIVPGVNVSASTSEILKARIAEQRINGEAVKPEDLPMQKSMRNKKASPNVEIEMVFNDGTSKILYGNAVPVLNKAGDVTGCVSAFIDITEMKKTREALKESEEQLRFALESAGAGSWEWDAKSGREKWSAENYALLGVDRRKSDPLPEDWLNVVLPEDREKFLIASQESIENKTALNFEYRIQHPSKGIRWILGKGKTKYDDNGDPLKMAGIAIDITERKQIEEALRESNERFIMLADSAPVLIWMADKDKNYNYFNKGWLDFTGKGIAEESGKQWTNGIHPEDRENVIKYFSTAFNNRESYVMEYRLRRADGQYRWILDKGIPRYEGNVFVGYIGSCIDITERKIAENHLRIQYSIANALTESKNLKDATYKVLESLCRGLGWELGMWWVVDKHTNLLKVESIWKDDILKDKTNELFDYNAVFKPGEGLPGTVWEEGNSKWVNDIMSDPNFPRKKLASSLGLHAAFAFPTWSGEEVTGIIECFSDKILTSKEDLLELLDAAGRQIGNFVERKTAEAKYQDLYENAPDMHISFDPVSGIITQCNTTLENVSGYRKEELIGKRIYSLFHAGSISQVRKIQAEFNKTGYVKNAELQLKKKDGSKVDVILNASAVRDEDGNIIYSRSSIRDISERKQLELAIQQRDIELTDFLENAPVGVSRIAEDGTILWANDAEIESLGYKRKNYIGHNINEFLLDKNLWGKIVKLLRKDELIENFDLQILSKDGSIKYWLISTNVYSENGRFIYAKTFSRDITLRKIAERDLNVQYSVSSTLAESRTFKNAALKILQAICEGVGWQLGLWWKVEDTSNKLKIQSYWYSSKLKYIDFDFFDPAYGHTKNDGLPGRVWNTQHPYWVTDINKDKKFKRVKTASKMGLKSAFAFPIMIGNKVAAVIECFSDSVISPNVELLNMLDSAGRQIGNFIERINAEEALIEANNTLEERVKERTSQLKNVIEKLEHEIKEREKAEKEIEILAQAIKSTNDSVSITDLSNRILFVNNAFEDTYGYREEEVLGKSINIIRSKKVSKALTSQINESTLKGGWQGELENIKKDGTEFPVWLSTSIVKDDARKPRAFIGVSVDITESKKNQLLIEKQSGLVKLLQEITVAANETFDIKEALKITVNKICRHIGWEVGHVYLLNKNNVLESSRIWHLENPKKFSSFKNLTEKTLMTTGFGIPGKVMEIKQSLWIEDINASNIFARSRLKGKNVLKSALAFPILVNNEIAGVMEFFTARNIEEDKQIMNITENIGSQLGRVIERSRALDTIKDSETRFRAVAETANEAIVTTDSDFNILYFNRSAENIFQYRENEIKGKNFLDLFSVNEHDELKKTYRQIRKSDKNITGRTIEFAGVRKDSSEFPLDLSLASWKSTDGVYYTAMIRDISKRKKAEMELRKRESQLRYAQHIAHMGSFEWDIQNNHVTWSDELYKIYGVGMNEFDGTFEAFIKYIHPEDKENIRQQVENMLAKGSAFSLEERIIRPSGEIRILQTRGEFLKDENGNIVKLLGACQDITERKKAEEQLLLSEKQLRDAQKIAHLGSWEWNIQLNKLTFSEEFYRIYGIEPFSIPPEKINTISFIHPEDKPWAENLGKSLLLEQKPFGVFYRIILPDGKIKFIKAEGEVDTDSDGKVKRMFGSIQDVTEQKEIEEELRFANEKLRLAQNELIHSEKLAALGRFSSGIAHEIRNPLANISALAQILMSKYKVDQKMKKHLRYILINTDIANRIIKDLLNFASPDDVVYRAGSLEKIINNLYNIVKSRCVRNKVHLIKKISPNLPAIQLNEKKLQAAFLNFISNAIDAMPKGGKLRIDAELDKKNKEVIISFEDTGIGISQEYMDKIFEPFFTTKDDGTGLGLSLAYQVIKSHAGKLEIQSKIGHGTKIEVKLPARIE